MTLDVHPRARAEINSLVAWYEERRDGLGADLRDEVWRALALVVEHPSRWPPSRIPEARARGVRHVLIRRFRVSIEYVVRGDAVRVLAIADTRRRPGYWVRRLPIE